MGQFSTYFRQSATYQIYRLFAGQIDDFFTTIGEITKKLLAVTKYILKMEVNKKELLEQCARFGVSSLPITFAIVGMSAIIVSMQVAGEMATQGAGNFVGM